MARQLLADGPFIDPPTAAPLSADTATTAVDMWEGARFTPIFANDAKAGKIYVVEAGGILSTGASGTLTISPFYGGSGGVALGASGAQTTVVSLTNVPWYLRFVMVFRSVNRAASGQPLSAVTCTGMWEAAGATATAGSSMAIAFGSTATSDTLVDITANKDITIRKTLSVAGSWSTNWCYIFSQN